MSVSIVHCRASLGVDAPPVVVETHISSGLPALAIVGMPETSVKESRERVRSALINSGFEFPTRRVTINLAPADLPKQGGRYDLAIAIGILAASGQLDQADLRGVEFVGELALTGELRPVTGVLPTAIAAQRAGRTLVIPEANANEAVLCPEIKAFAFKHLLELCAHLVGKSPAEALASKSLDTLPRHCPDLADVKGQHLPRRALEIAAAGGLNLLMFGPPGTGKSMLAARLPSLMPLLSKDEALSVASIYSVAGVFSEQNYFQRPFRSPHHSASSVAMVGGGSSPKPGEVSLAHCGVLFLDELPEFGRKVLEMLREPLEAGQVAISRAMGTIEYPAKFQLIAAMNPCPCGYLGHPKRQCTDSPQQIYQYRKKLSGPLLDRFDMHVEVAYQAGAVILNATQQEESSAVVRDRVERAHARQYQRQQSLNAALQANQIAQYCPLQDELRETLEKCMERLALSARSAHRIIRVARTIADLTGSEDIELDHLLEAMAYRALDREQM